MKLVPGNFLSEQDYLFQAILHEEHPDLHEAITRLVNSYRMKLSWCLDMMHQYGIDTADLIHACEKTENLAHRLGIPPLFLESEGTHWLYGTGPYGEETEPDLC